MPTYAEVIAKWEARRGDTLAARGLVPLSDVAVEVLSDLASIIEQHDNELVDRATAARECGYSPDSLSRLVRKKQLRNHGTPHRPLFLRSELPKKPQARTRGGMALVHDGNASTISAIARDAVATRMGRPKSA